VRAAICLAQNGAHGVPRPTLTIRVHIRPFAVNHSK